MSTDFENRPSKAQTPYMPMSLNVLRVDELVDFDLYLRRSAETFVLYRNQQLPFTEEVKSRIREAGVGTVYVRAAQDKAFRHYIERNLGAILDDDTVSPEQKADLLYGSLVNVVEDVMQEPRAGETIPRSKDIVRNTCKFLYQQRGSLEYMMRVCSFDYYTYTHSVNVFVFAMALGQRIFPQEHLENEFGLGALLHDVGKSRIPVEILNFKGKLSDEQFTIMKNHTTYGYEILQSHSGAPPLVLDMVRHHHERIKGGGYPDNLSEDQIAKEVRILTIADIFDALTTRRSYKDPMDSFPALKMMREKMSDHIDPEIFRAFVAMMGNPSENPMPQTSHAMAAPAPALEPEPEFEAPQVGVVRVQRA